MESRNLAIVPATNFVISDRQEEFFEEISKKLSKDPNAQKEWVEALRQSYCDNEENIQHLAENPEYVAERINFFTETLQNVAHLLPPVKKIAPLFALSFLSKVSADNLQIVSGAAPGGTNLCSGFLNCIQGHIVNTASQEVVTAFNAFLNLSGKVNLGAVWAFNNAMSVESVGNIAKDFFVKNATKAAETVAECVAEYNVQGVTAGSHVSNLSPLDCFSYQNAFKAKAQRDLADGTVSGLSAAISFIILGIILFIAGTYCVVRFCLCKK